VMLTLSLSQLSQAPLSQELTRAQLGGSSSHHPSLSEPVYVTIPSPFDIDLTDCH
jgi:hypothetical protein